MFDLRNRLSRVTSGSQYLPEIDGLRFLAIMPVVALHVASFLYLFKFAATRLPRDWGETSGSLFLWAVSTGWMGVPVFFVISGFILGLPFAQHYRTGKPAPELRRYYLRRLTRIEPPYLVALTAYWLLGPITLGWTPNYLAGLVYQHVLVFGALNPVLIVSWSLEIEVVFYAITPWLARIYRSGPDLLRWGAAATGILAYSYWIPPKLMQAGSVRLANTLPAFLQYFAVGLLLADLYAGGRIQRTKSRLWDLVGVASLVLVFTLAGRDAWRYRWLCPALIGLMVAAAFRGDWFNRFLRLPAVSLTGGMCYSIYLFHIAVVGASAKVLFPLFPRTWSFETMTIAALAIQVPLALIVSAVLFLLVEKPFMNGAGSRYLEALFRRRGELVPSWSR